MSVHKDPVRNTWYFRVRIDGKHYSRSGFRTKKDALREEHDFKTEQVVLSGSDAPVKDVYDKYLDYCRAHLTGESVSDKEITYRLYMEPVIGKLALDAVTSAHIVEIQNLLNEKNFAYEYKRKIFYTLNSFFKYAHQQHNLIRNPVDYAPRFKNRKVKDNDNYWTFEEFKSFIEAVDKPIWNLVFQILYYTGIRKSELLALQWTDIDGDEIVISKTLRTRETGEQNYLLAPPKTRNSNRRVLMPNFLSELLNEYRKWCEQHYDGFTVNSFLFGFNRPFSKTNLDHWKNIYIEKSGVKKITIHGFRHSHASLLINDGANILVVSKRLGHSSIKETLDRYSHMFPSSQIEIVKKLPFIKSSSFR